MQAESFLLTVAQAGIALAGFSALISAFRRGDVQLTPLENYGRNMILEMGLVAALFALIPFPTEQLLILFGFAAGVWRLSSAAMVIFLIGWGVLNFTRYQKVISAYPSGALPTQIGFNMILGLIGAFLVLNVFFFGSASFYMIGLIWMLALSGVQFLGFVYSAARK